MIVELMSVLYSLNVQEWKFTLLGVIVGITSFIVEIHAQEDFCLNSTIIITILSYLFMNTNMLFIIKYIFIIATLTNTCFILYKILRNILCNNVILYVLRIAEENKFKYKLQKIVDITLRISKPLL